MKKLLVIIISLLLPTIVLAANTQTNVSGSNTSIEGGYTGGATTYESGSSSSTTTNSTSNSNIRSAPPTSSAPSYNSMTQDVCAVGASAGLQTFGIGTRPFFWPMHKQKIFRYHNIFNSKKFSNSEYISKYGFYLPSSLSLKNSEIDYICKKVNLILHN